MAKASKASKAALKAAAEAYAAAHPGESTAHHAAKRMGPMHGKSAAEKAAAKKRAHDTRMANKEKKAKRLAILRTKPYYKPLAPMSYLKKRLEYLQAAMKKPNRPA